MVCKSQTISDLFKWQDFYHTNVHTNKIRILPNQEELFV